MGARRLSMRKLREILRLKYERRMGHRAISRACGVGVGTVSEYVRRAREVGLNWPLPPDLDDRTLEAQLLRSWHRIASGSRPTWRGFTRNSSGRA